MGCDIHIVVERRKSERPTDEWIGFIATDYHPGCRLPVAARDYNFFAEVANVRGNTSTHKNYPRNLPEDVSDLAWQQYMRAPTDYHSPSNMPLDEFCENYVKINPEKARAEHTSYDLFGIYGDEGFEYRVVFWFDN
jgi:hypothetical protein